MGVYIQAQISGLEEGMLDALVNITGYPLTKWYNFDYGQVEISGTRWYDHRGDLRELSKCFPKAKIEAYFADENGDKWMIYALSGEIEVCDSIETFEPRTLW